MELDQETLVAYGFARSVLVEGKATAYWLTLQSSSDGDLDIGFTFDGEGNLTESYITASEYETEYNEEPERDWNINHVTTLEQLKAIYLLFTNKKLKKIF